MPPAGTPHSETPSPRNPLRTKGAGEGGTIASIAAIIGAIENALAPFRVKINKTPIARKRIVALVNEKRAGDARCMPR
jgi:carbon-monoxide dehydrogenase large subunit